MEACGKLGKYSSVEIRLILRDLYEQHYGIFDHLKLGKSRPLASVALHPAEEFSANSALHESALLFARKKMYELFGMSHLELLKLPREIVGIYFSVADKEMSSRTEIADNVETSLKRELDKRNMDAPKQAAKGPLK